MATTPRMTPEIPFASRSLPLDQVEDLLKLQKAAQKITSILDLDELIDKVVNEIAQSFGCLEAHIYLHDQEHGDLVLAGVCGCTTHCKGDRKKIGEGMVGHAAAIGRMYYAPDVRQDPYYIRCEESTLSEVAIPLIVQGQLVGVFNTSHPDLDAFPPDQLRLLQVLSSHIAVAVQNARLFQQERQAREKMTREAHEARSIQQALLPKSSPYIPGFAVSGLCIPAGAVGGDWYDFIALGDGRWGLVLADVSGKGTAAALLMSATRGMLRSLAETVCTPSEVLTKLNRLLVDDFPPGRFVTLVYAVLDPASRTLTFANAGHLRPLLFDHDGGRYLDTERGLPLGISSGSYSETKVSLAPGARLLFYSDGLTEAENPAGEEYGPQRLLQQVARPDTCAECVLEDVRHFSNGAGPQDDATVIFVRG